MISSIAGRYFFIWSKSNFIVPYRFYRDILPIDYDFDVYSDQKLADMLTQVKKKDYKKRVLARLPLDLGMGQHLAISLYSFIQKAYGPPKVKLARCASGHNSNMGTCKT